MRRRKKASSVRKRFWFIAHCVFTAAKISLGLLIVSLKLDCWKLVWGEPLCQDPPQQRICNRMKNHNL